MMTGLVQHIIKPKLGISKRLFGAKHHATLHASEQVCQKIFLDQFSPPFHTERGIRGRSGKGRVKYRVKAAYVIVNFVMNSAGPPRTLDSISALRCAVPHPLCT